MAKRNEVEVGQWWNAQFDDDEFGAYEHPVRVTAWIDPYTVEAVDASTPPVVTQLPISHLVGRIMEATPAGREGRE